MAYNLQPLVTILEQILDPQQTCWNIHDDSKLQLQSLLEKTISLQQILEKYSLHIEISLEREIRDAVHKAEDIIESRMVDGMLSNASLTDESMISFPSADLQQVMQQLDSAMEQVVKLVEELVLGDGGRFPPSLRNLTLSDSKINWRMMSTLCGLPNLEVLQINACEFETNETREEWELREGEEFRSLQSLRLQDLKLVRWRADETNFPKLRHLIVEHCQHLEEIPRGIEKIRTLEFIEMTACSASAVVSAKQILEEQLSDYGNYDLQLRIYEQ